MDVQKKFMAGCAGLRNYMHRPVQTIFLSHAGKKTIECVDASGKKLI